MGPENDRYLARAARHAATHNEPIIAAWGNNAQAHRVASVLTIPLLAERLHSIGVTLSGAPKHPLARGKHRIPRDAQPTPWTLPAC